MDGEVVTISNGTLRLETTDINIGNLVTFVFIKDCQISSSSPINISIQAFTSSSGGSLTSTLSLINVTFIVSSASNVTDTLFDLSNNGVLIADTCNITIVYNYLNPGDYVLKGGQVVVTGNGPNTLAYGIYMSGNKTVGGPALPTVRLTSIINNHRLFVTNLPLYVPNPASISGRMCKYSFYGRLTTYGNLNFSSCGVTIFEVNTNGGTLNIDNGAYDLYYNVSTIINTTVNINQNVAIVMNQIRRFTLPPRSPFGTFQLDSNSYLNFNDPLSTILNMNMLSTLTASASPFNSIQLTVASSNNGQINCNGITQSQYKQLGAQKLTPILQLLDLWQPGPAFLQEAISICTDRTLSLRIWRSDNTGPIDWIPPCPNGLIICFYAGVGCVTLDVCMTMIGSCNYPNSQAAVLGIAATQYPISYNCWDGECVFDVKLCNPFPACPVELPRRCSGYCTLASSQCQPCNSTLGQFECPQGCLNSTQTCGPYQGCALGQLQCADNLACVSDLSDCTKYGNSHLPFGTPVLKSFTDIYPTSQSVAAIWRITRDKRNITSPYHIDFPLNTVPVNMTFAAVRPYPDSLGLTVNGTLIDPNFNYYTHLLTPPFGLKIQNLTNVNFGNRTVSLYFENQFNRSISSMCLAFINDQSMWECTPYPLEPIDGGKILHGRTNHFTNFAVLLKYNPDLQERAQQAGTSQKMIIIVSVTVCAIVFGAIIVGIIANLTLKHQSFHRVTMKLSDPELARYKDKNFRAR